MIEHLRFLNNVKLAHSFARAVDADWPLIDMITQGDHQVVEDRRVALDMSTIDDDLETHTRTVHYQRMQRRVRGS